MEILVGEWLETAAMSGTLSSALLGYVFASKFCPNAQNALIAGKFMVSRGVSGTDFLALMAEKT